MNGGIAERIETTVDAGAAALLGAAMAFALVQLNASNGYVATAAAVVLAWVYYGLRSIELEPVRFALADFAPGEFEAEEAAELILTDADRLEAPDKAADAELVLDDILAELGPDSRVVRLFDPAAMPSPGQLKARIDRQLGQETPKTAPPDASEALYDALAELRRSLR